MPPKKCQKTTHHEASYMVIGDTLNSSQTNGSVSYARSATADQRAIDAMLHSLFESAPSFIALQKSGLKITDQMSLRASLPDGFNVGQTRMDDGFLMQ